MDETNNNIARQLIRDVFLNHRLAIIDELLSDNFIYSSDLIPEPKDKHWLKDMLQQIFIAFPEFIVTIDNIHSDNNLVTLNLNSSGTLRSDFMGLKARGQSFSGPGVMILEIKDQKIIRIQAKLNTAENLAQLK